MKFEGMKALGFVFACVFALVVAVALVGNGGRSLFGGWSFTESATFDRGTYFRLKVKLDYKGEPQDIDIVVGCNVLDINYKDGSNTHEVGLVPTVYGRRMSDGKGHIIRPPDACDGETRANGKVPADFMPLIVVYDDADTLGFGTAYLSDEAYESPLSVLKFGSATIEAATRTEFEDFRKNGIPNLVSRASYFGTQSEAFLKPQGLEREWPPFGKVCHAYKRFRIPQKVRAEVRKLWPANRPNYWYPPGYAELGELGGMILRAEPQRDDGGPSRSWDRYSGNEYTADVGIANRSGRGMVHRFNLYPPPFYPVSSTISADKWASYPGSNAELLAGRSEIVVNQIDYLDEKTRGFAYCYADPGSFVGGELAERLYRDVDLLARVDDQRIAGGAKSWRNAGSNLHSFFERDEYFFTVFELYIDSVRGDV